MKTPLLRGFSFVWGPPVLHPEQGFIRKDLPAADHGESRNEVNGNPCGPTIKKGSVCYPFLLLVRELETVDGGSPRRSLLRKVIGVEARA